VDYNNIILSFSMTWGNAKAMVYLNVINGKVKGYDYESGSCMEVVWSEVEYMTLKACSKYYITNISF
jgi:hypothetical protein